MTGGPASDPTPTHPARADPTDRQLLTAHLAGSTTAFSEIIARHQSRLWAVALRITADPEEAADVLQEAAVKAFRSAEAFRGEAAVSTWLHRIVVNAALDAVRRTRRAQVLPLVPDDPAHVASGTVADPVAARQVSLDVADALARLPADQRAAVTLVDLDGFSVDEAASILGCPPGTVKSRCFRARARLAPLLADYAPRRVADPAGEGGNRGEPAHVQPDEGAGPSEVRR